MVKLYNRRSVVLYKQRKNSKVLVWACGNLDEIEEVVNKRSIQVPKHAWLCSVHGCLSIETTPVYAIDKRNFIRYI